MNEFAYVVQAWLPLIVWQQVDEPEYRKGYITVTCLSVSLIITAFATRWLYNGQLGRKALETRGAYDTGSESNEEVSGGVGGLHGKGGVA